MRVGLISYTKIRVSLARNIVRNSERTGENDRSHAQEGSKSSHITLKTNNSRLTRVIKPRQARLLSEKVSLWNDFTKRNRKLTQQIYSK